MLVGCHVSTSGGVGKALGRATEVGCECFQIFTKSQLQWRSSPLESDQVSHWYEEWEASGWLPCFVHDSYLINLASPDKASRSKSVDAFVDELERAEILGIPWVNTHPGSHRGAGEQAGLESCAESIAQTLERTKDLEVGVLLETTAGQGNDLGSRFDQLGYLVKATGSSPRVGVCVDTCHIFAAGYDLKSADGYERTWAEFEKLIGLGNLYAFHLNDSKFPLGGHRDRHAEIGTGFLGKEAFKRLMNDPRFEQLIGACELPGENGAAQRSIEVLKNLRDL